MRSLRYRHFDAAGKSFEVDRLWEWQQQRRFSGLLDQLRSTKRHETCIIVGNGPSLNSTDLSLLSSSDVFISNFAFEHPVLLESAKLLAIVNHLVAEQATARLMEAVGGSIPVLTTSHLRYAMPANSNSYYVPMAATPEFQLTANYGASCQSSVTYFLLQVAYWVGYQRVLLIGVDNSYQQPDVMEGQVLLQEGFDPNHFSGSYFENKHWHAADVDRMAAAYEFARDVYGADNRSIVDCTVGGQLRVFPKGDLAEMSALSIDSAPVSARGLDRVWLQGIIERRGLPFLFGAALLMMIALVAHFVSPSLVPLSSLTLLIACLVPLICVACIGVVKNQLRQSNARTRFELSVLRMFISRQKNV